MVFLSPILAKRPEKTFLSFFQSDTQQASSTGVSPLCLEEINNTWRYHEKYKQPL